MSFLSLPTETCNKVSDILIICTAEEKNRLSELQIRGSIDVICNSKIIFLISQRKHMLWPLIRTVSTVLMVGHKICFDGEIGLIIPKLSLILPLIWSTYYLVINFGYFCFIRFSIKTYIVTLISTSCHSIHVILLLQSSIHC